MNQPQQARQPAPAKVREPQQRAPVNYTGEKYFVQGHIDCVSPVVEFGQSGVDFRLNIELPAAFAHYVVVKGSIAVNGISLTIAEVLPTSFVVWIVPHTKRHTNLDHARAGTLLNLEFDIVAKYVERMLSKSSQGATASQAFYI